jgi:hypothetical protein
VKFTEGAWVIVIIFPVLVFLLIRLNREYRMESGVLENMQERRKFGAEGKTPNYSRRVVLVFVDSVDLATFAAIRFARGLRPTGLRAVHFVVDAAHAEKLREEWVRYGQEVPLEMIDTPDRRILRASGELVIREAEQPGTSVTVVLPRRSFSPLLGRLLHDRTADKIAAVVSRVPNCVATIVSFDVESRVAELHAHAAAGNGAVPGNGAAPGPVTSGPATAGPVAPGNGNGTRPAATVALSPGIPGISALGTARKAAVEGRVRAVEIRRSSTAACSSASSMTAPARSPPCSTGAPASPACRRGPGCGWRARSACAPTGPP